MPDIVLVNIHKSSTGYADGETVDKSSGRFGGSTSKIRHPRSGRRRDCHRCCDIKVQVAGAAENIPLRRIWDNNLRENTL